MFKSPFPAKTNLILNENIRRQFKYVILLSALTPMIIMLYDLITHRMKMTVRQVFTMIALTKIALAIMLLPLGFSFKRYTLLAVFFNKTENV